MITKNSSGAALSALYAPTVRADSRQFLAALYVDGAELSCDIKRMEVAKGSCGSVTAFTVGSVVANTLTVEVANLTDDVKGAVVEARIGLNTGSAWEYVTLGHFTITDAPKTRYTATLTGYGLCATTTGGMIQTADITTIEDLLQAVQEVSGRGVELPALVDTSYALTIGLPEISAYQGLQLLAFIVGGYATDTIDGDITVRAYSGTATTSADTGMMTQLPDAEEQDFTITGLTVRAIETHTSGSPVNVVLDNEYVYVTDEIFDNVMAPNLLGYEYRTADILLSLGDPRIEGTDVVEVTDLDGQVYSVPCHSVRHIYDGGLRTEIKSARATAEENEVATQTSLSGSLKVISGQVAGAYEAASTALSKAEEVNNYFWFSPTDTGGGVGAHVTEVTREEFITAPGDGGGNVQIMSRGIYVRDGLDVLASFTGDGARIGSDSTPRFTITNDAIRAQNDVGASFFAITAAGGSIETDVSVCPAFTNIGAARTITLDASGVTAGSSMYLTGLVMEFVINNMSDGQITGYSFDGGAGELVDNGASGTARAIAMRFAQSYLEGQTAFEFGTASNYSAEATISVINNDGTAYTISLQVLLAYDGNATVRSFPLRYTGAVDGLKAGASSYTVREIRSRTAQTYAPAFTLGTRSGSDGDCSVVAGRYLYAEGEDQFAIGHYNEQDTTGETALSIGNGDDTNRSDAFRVAWDGNQFFALDTSVGTGTADGDIYEALTLLGWDSEVIV
jgi:hypothetical protein